MWRNAGHGSRESRVGREVGISLYFDVHFNAVFNSLLLVFFAIPLGFTWSAFSGKKGLGEGQPD